MNTDNVLAARKDLAERLANLVAETVLHTPDVFDREVLDVLAHPSSGFRGDGFVVELTNGMGFVVQLQTYNDPREKADALSYNYQHHMSPWKPIRSTAITFVTSCINCDKVAIVYKDGSIGGTAIKTRCYVDSGIPAEHREEV